MVLPERPSVFVVTLACQLCLHEWHVEYELPFGDGPSLQTTPTRNGLRPSYRLTSCNKMRAQLGSSHRDT